jgi:hypothetical protein
LVLPRPRRARRPFAVPAGAAVLLRVRWCMRRGALMHRRGRDGDDHDDNSRRRCRHYDDNDGIAFTPAAGTHVIRTRSHMNSLTRTCHGLSGRRAAMQRRRRRRRPVA